MTQLIQWLLAEFPEGHPRISELYPHKRCQIACWDPDHSNKTLMRYHPGHARYMDINDVKQLDESVIVFGDGVEISLIDGLGSQYGRVFHAWIEEANLFELLEDLQARLTYLLVVEEDWDVLTQIKDLYTKVGTKADWICVRSQRLTSTLHTWQGSELRKGMLADGAMEIDMPKIHESLMTLANKGNFSLEKGQFATVEDGVDTFDKQRFLTNTKKFYSEFKKCERLILPNE